jgi:hypothetical protein
MEYYKLKKEDYINIFEYVLENMQELCEYDNNDEIPVKWGICNFIHKNIEKLYPALHIDTRQIIYGDCIDIISCTTGFIFKASSYYWYTGYKQSTSIKTWYKPRIKCVEYIIDYLKNL